MTGGNIQLGLSASHISPRPRLEVAVTGRLVRLSAGVEVKGRRGGGRRGRVKGFSKGSRRRLMRLFASLNQRISPPIFITLTYPAEWPEEPWVWKRHLDTFCKRVLRRWPRAAIIWRLEFQRRGAPHFHLLVFNVRFIPKEWLSSAWNEVVRGGREHRAAGTRVERVRSWKGVFSYVSKYMAKVEEVDGYTGRVWGVYGRRNLVLSEVVVFYLLSLKDFFRMRRVLARYARVSLRGFGWWWGLTVFAPPSLILRGPP